jgi:hypothetical protein
MPPRGRKRKTTESAEQITPPSKRRTRHHEPPGTTANRLNDLPEELILGIMDHLIFPEEGNPHRHSQTLHDLCLTSRKFYRLAKPYLYMFIDNIFVDPGKLLESAIQDPKLSEHIKFLCWVDDFQGGSYVWDYKSRHKLSHIHRRELCKVLDRLGVPEARGFSRGFQEQDPRDSLASLLLLAPKIESLEVTDMNLTSYSARDKRKPYWVRLLAHVALGTSPGLACHFQQLSSIRLRMGSMGLEYIIPLLRLPALRALMLEDVFYSGKIMPWRWEMEVGPRCSPIEVLYIENSYIDSAVVAQILNTIKSLKVFCLEFGSLMDTAVHRLFEEDPPKLTYSTLSKALMEHKDTLEQLSIEDCLDGVLREFFGDQTDCLGSLREMHKLRYIDIGLCPFREGEAGAILPPANLIDNLPCNVEHIDINIEEKRGDEEEEHWKRSLEELAKSCKATYPLLQDIRVSKRLMGAVAVDEEVMRIKALFKEQGVTLTMCGEEGFRPQIPMANGEMADASDEFTSRLLAAQLLH